MMATFVNKVSDRLDLVFIAMTVPLLIVDDPSKIDAVESTCKYYRDLVLRLLIFYHVMFFILARTQSDWYLLMFCLVFGVFQTFIADNYLCSYELMDYPLNTYPLTEFLGYCLPEYMIFAWSIFAFIELKIGLCFDGFCNIQSKVIPIIVSSTFGFALIIGAEIMTNIPEAKVKVLPLWKANDKHKDVNLFFGGLASYLVLPELCLCVILAIFYHTFLHRSIKYDLSAAKVIFNAIIGSLMITLIYYSMIKSELSSRQSLP